MSNTNRKEKVTTVTKFALSAVIKIEQIKSIKKDKCNNLFFYFLNKFLKKKYEKTRVPIWKIKLEIFNSSSINPPNLLILP